MPPRHPTPPAMPDPATPGGSEATGKAAKAARPKARTTSEKPPEPPRRRARGFEAAGHLAQDRISEGARKRGAMLARLLGHWGEIAGPDLGAITRPLRTHFGRDGLGATLTLAAAPATAPMLQMRLPDLTARINAALGYAAIARIKLVQSDQGSFTAGLAEAPASFAAAPKAPAPPPAAASELATVSDPGLRAALETLGRNLSSRPRHTGARS